MFRKIYLIGFLFAGCANSADIPGKEKAIDVKCEIQNEYGLIGCGDVPLSINQEINTKFIKKCKFSIDEINESNYKCLLENSGNPSDQFLLGDIQYYGLYSKKNQVEALKNIKSSANEDYPEAVFWLGKYYADLNNEKKGFYYIRRAAEFGNPLAMHSLGARYHRGIGTSINNNLAMEWLNISKEYIAASYSEMALIKLKEGNVKDFIKYNEIAIKKHYWFAYVDLIVLYLGNIDGYSQYIDLEKANIYSDNLIKKNIAVGYFLKAEVLKKKNTFNGDICNLYEKSLENGYLLAGVNLGQEYVEGVNCKKNYTLALNTFKYLYENSNGEVKMLSATNLGYLYLNGLGVIANKEIAKNYLSLPVQKGFSPAIEMLKNLE